MFGTHLWEHRWKGLGFQVCGFGVWGTALWGIRVVDMGRTYPVMGNRPSISLGSRLWEHMKVAFYGVLFSAGSRICARRFPSGSRLWGIAKVPVYGSPSESILCLAPAGSTKPSHRQGRYRTQVTFYGETEWLPFMGAFSTFGTNSKTIEDADRYPPMGIDEGSKLWEKTAAVLRGTTNRPDDLDSAHLPPWMATFVVANLVPGLPVPTGKVAAFGRNFDQKVDGYGALHKSIN